LINDYGLQYQDELEASIIAMNDRGESMPSSYNVIQALVEEVPRQMLSITQGSDTTNVLIHLEWLEPDTGGSQIISYIVYYRMVGEPDFVELIGEQSSFTELEYRITHGVVEGGFYEFKAKAINRWGLSYWWSDVTTILAATTPD
jgi:hypothetical protein